jgi:uncharacterized protein (DUF2062 family)
MLMAMVICASLAALALGVLLAYGVCRLMFGLFRHDVQMRALRAQSGAVAATTKVAPSAL